MKYRQTKKSWGRTHINSKYQVTNDELFEEIISLENLFEAWKEFRRGKGRKLEVQQFELHLEDNIFALHHDLKNGNYCHGTYESFYVCDPKRRHIHKPGVRDRLVHHAIFRILEPMYDKSFIYDVWSCRKEKGTHGAVKRFQKIAWKLSRNNTRPVWVLKMDIEQYFANVDQEILLNLLARKITDKKCLDLLRIVIKSFSQGIPLGNLTSQLFANVYLNELDRFITHNLRLKFYSRYGDDFMVLNKNRSILINLIPTIRNFLSNALKLVLHPQKIILSPYHKGIDFLGFVCFPFYRVLRTKTKKRLLAKVADNNLPSYLGLLKHCRSWKILNQVMLKIQT